MILEEIAGALAVCRLDGEAPVPAWLRPSSLVSITRTTEELSIVCAEADVPAGVRCEGGWSCLKVRGPLDFELTGILAALTGPLAQAGVPVFAVSTFDTDYLLVKAGDLARARAALARAGHEVRGAGGKAP